MPRLQATHWSPLTQVVLPMLFWSLLPTYTRPMRVTHAVCCVATATLIHSPLITNQKVNRSANGFTMQEERLWMDESMEGLTLHVVSGISITRKTRIKQLMNSLLYLVQMWLRLCVHHKISSSWWVAMGFGNAMSKIASLLSRASATSARQSKKGSLSYAHCLTRCWQRLPTRRWAVTTWQLSW